MHKAVQMLHCLLYDVFSIKSYHFFHDRAVDTLDNGKYVVDGFNAVQKRYLDSCLRMRSTLEVGKIGSKRTYVDGMTKEG